MIDKIYIYIKHGSESKEFSNIKELNIFLDSIGLESFEDTGSVITVLPNNGAIYIHNPLDVFDMRKYGYRDCSTLDLLEFNGVMLIADDTKPAFYSLTKLDNGFYKSKSIAITTEETSDGYFKRRIRVDGKKVSITKLIKKV